MSNRDSRDVKSKVARLEELFDDLCSEKIHPLAFAADMDALVVDDRATVEALIANLDWSGTNGRNIEDACLAALTRATVELPLVCDALNKRMDASCDAYEDYYTLMFALRDLVPICEDALDGLLGKICSIEVIDPNECNSTINITLEAIEEIADQVPKDHSGNERRRFIVRVLRRIETVGHAADFAERAHALLEKFSTFPDRPDGPLLKSAKWPRIRRYRPSSREGQQVLTVTKNGICDLSHQRNGLDIDGLLAAADLSRVRSLVLSGVGVRSSEIERLANCERLGELQCLRVDANQIDGKGLAAIVASPYLRQLRDLDIHYNPLILDAGARDLAMAWQTPGLETLNLSQCGLTEAGLGALASCRGAAWLREIDISINKIDGPGFCSLIASPSFSNLRKIRASSCGLTLTSVAALTQSSLSAGLRWLDLSDNYHLGDDALLDLFASSQMIAIEHLDLSRISMYGKRRLEQDLPATRRLFSMSTDRVSMPSLHHLCLRHHGSLGSPAVAELFFSWPQLATLKTLDVSHVGFGERGVRALLRSPYLTRLTNLNLELCGIPLMFEDAVRHSPNLPNLRDLKFGRQIDDDDR